MRLTRGRRKSRVAETSSIQSALSRTAKTKLNRALLNVNLPDIVYVYYSFNRVGGKNEANLTFAYRIINYALLRLKKIKYVQT